MIEYSGFTLDNGLRVVHSYVPDVPQATLSILYNVGSRDDAPEHTGMAHLFEHLMFGGSAHVPDYDYAIEMASGDNNGFTGKDFTVFYCTLPSANLATAFWAESDRMLSPSIASSLEVQKRVVVEEMKQVCLNVPYGDVAHKLLPLIYGGYPYSRPTIGLDAGHIESVTLRDAEAFFRSHYSPDNAVLSVCGNVEPERVMELARRWFGPIERRPVAPRRYGPVQPIMSPRRREVTGDVPQTRIYIAVQLPAISDPDFMAADLLTDILASGGTSRFYRRLVMGSDVFTMADSYVSEGAEAGYLVLKAALHGSDDYSIRVAEDMLWREIDDVAEHGVSEMELQRAVCRFELQRAASFLQTESLANELAQATMLGVDINGVPQAYRSITPDDIRRVAATMVCRESSATLIYRSSGGR